MPRENLTWLQKMLTLCHVPRWAIVPMLRRQSVAEHSFRVASIAVTLGTFLKKDKEYLNALTACAMVHDIEEAYTGDIPSSEKPVHSPTDAPIWKRSRATLNCSVIGDVYVITKIADIIEAIQFLSMWGPATPQTGAIIDKLQQKLAKWVDHYETAWPGQLVSVAVSNIMSEIQGR